VPAGRPVDPVLSNDGERRSAAQFDHQRLLGRYLLVGFARDHSIASEEGTMMVDGFVTMLQLAAWR
jgi:hypothetical protein